MKMFRQFAAALVLTFVFALPALAGDMDCPVVPPPSPATEAGEISTPGMNTESEAADDSITETLLALLDSVLSLF